MCGVVIFAEEPAVGLGFQAMLLARRAFQPLAVCQDRGALAGALAEHRPHFLLYVLGGEECLSEIQGILNWTGNAGLILVTREVAPDFAYQALRLGVRAILSSSAPSETLHQCLRAAAAGEAWVSPSLAAQLCRSRTIALSPRQGELLGLLAQGLKNKEIAAAMGLTENTVKAYLGTLCEKVGAKDRFELAMIGLKNLRPTGNAPAGDEPRAPVLLRALARF